LGPIILGATVGWRGGENYIGDYRAPGGSTFAYFGYAVGAFVPSAGLSLNLAFKKDRERGRELDQRQLTLGPFAGIEWSSDYWRSSSLALHRCRSKKGSSLGPSGWA